MKIHRFFYSIVMIFVLCMTSLTQSFIHANTNGRDISNSAVTDLTVSKSNIKDGESFRVDLKFDEKRGNIQSGDFIKVTWPTSTTNNTVFFEAYAKTFDLKVKDIVVGQAVISTDNAVLTFNDNITNLEDVEGSAYFEIRGRNLSQTQGEDTQLSSIQSGGWTAYVYITKPVEGVGSQFYYKTGDMQPYDTDRVRWFLLVNNTYSEVESDVRIEDEIQTGQVLDPSSFYIYTRGTVAESFYGENAIQKFNEKFSHSNITYDVNTNKIQVKIGKQDANKTYFNIMYLTNITDDTQPMFENKTKAWFHEKGYAAVSGESFDHSVKNISAGASIRGTVPGELKIYKVVEGTKTPIEGVQFQLKREDNDIIKDGNREIILTTNADGIANIKGLSVGKYIVKEHRAVDWVHFDPVTAPTYTFEVTLDDVHGSFFKVGNKMKTMDIPVKKEWIGPSQSEVLVDLYANDEKVDTIALSQQTNWEATFKDKPVYDAQNRKDITYTVKEQTVTGYQSKVTGDMRKGFMITNTNVEKISIPVKKEWVGPKKEQVEVILYADGVEKETVTLNEENQWESTFTHLLKYDQTTGKEIEYTVKEKEIEGYTSVITGNQKDGFVVTNTKMKDPKDYEDPSSNETTLLPIENTDPKETTEVPVKEKPTQDIKINKEKEADPVKGIQKPSVKKPITKEESTEKNTKKEEKLGKASGKAMHSQQKLNVETVQTSDSTNYLQYVGGICVSMMLIGYLLYRKYHKSA